MTAGMQSMPDRAGAAASWPGGPGVSARELAAQADSLLRQAFAAQDSAADASLPALLHAFNFRFARHVHPSWRERLAAGVAPAVWEAPRAQMALSAHIVRTLALDEPCLDAGRPEWPVALLDPQQMHLLARHVGAALLGPQVRRSLARDEVLHWQQALPGEYEFVMHAASLLHVPAIAGLAEAAGDWPCEALGCRVIAASVAAAPPALAERVWLKLPAELPELAIAPAAAHEFVLSIHSILEPQWRSSFATHRQ
jgi:hypothetical protein